MTGSKRIEIRCGFNYQDNWFISDWHPKRNYNKIHVYVSSSFITWPLQHLLHAIFTCSVIIDRYNTARHDDAFALFGRKSAREKERRRRTEEEWKGIAIKKTDLPCKSRIYIYMYAAVRLTWHLRKIKWRHLDNDIISIPVRSNDHGSRERYTSKSA